MDDSTFQPLVSVPVITYNSSKTVVETLDSIYDQTYPNMELIISDDCSTDNTVEICREWIEAHKERFVRTELLTVEKNTGVSANMNRAEEACRGEWVKPIAGDDVLLSNCVELYMRYVHEHSDAIYVFAKLETFGGDENRRREIDKQFLYDFFNWPIAEQCDFLILKRNCIPASTAFYNRQRINTLGIRNDERIPLLEDWPRWINLLKAGVVFQFIDAVTVKYRISDNALSTQKVLSMPYLKSNALFYLFYRHNKMYRIDKKNAVLNWLRAEKIVHDNSLPWVILFNIYKKMIKP